MARASLLLLLLTVALVAVLRGSQLVDRLPVERTLPVERLLELASFDCRSEQRGVLPEASLRLHPAAGSEYMAGLAGLAADETQQARETLGEAFKEEGNLIALVWLANEESAHDADGRLEEQEILAGAWSDEMRLAVAKYYFGRAGVCAWVNQEATRQYLAIGEQFLPVGAETQLDLRLARAISEAYLADERLEEALPWLTLAAAANDSSLLRLSRVLHQMGRPEKAIGYYERALLYYPDQTATRTWAVQAALEAGQPAAALRFLTAAPDWRALGPDTLLLWAGLCADQQDWDCARNQYQRVLELEPDNVDAAYGLETLPGN